MRLTLLGFGCVVLVCTGANKVVKDDEECVYALEILQVQDGSASFKAEIDNMAEFMADLTEDLRSIYGEFKFGVSSFVDKPIPLRGYGAYGNWEYAPDYCYREHAVLSQDNAEIISGLRELASNLGSGNDYPENPMEALIFAAGDPLVGWSPTEVTHSPSGRPIVRMIMLVTDDIPHFPTEAHDAIDRFWNWNRTYPDPNNPMISQGGFGAHNFHVIPNMPTVNVERPKDRAEYLEMADLFAIFDHQGDLTPAQADRLDTLIAKFGPYPWPSVIPHPGDNSIRDCTKTEYPTLEAVSKYLKARNMNLIFLVAKPHYFANEITKACRAIGMEPGTDCLVKLYTGYAEEMGVAAVVASIDGENTKDRILQSIKEMTNMMCLSTTTPAPNDDDTTSTGKADENSTESTSTEGKESSTTPMEPTTSDGALHPTTTPTTIATTTEGNNGGGNGVTTTEIATTESTHVVVVPPAGGGAGGEGPSKGIITGAAVGGAAALIAGGLLYAKFATGLFGGASSPGAVTATQVETPENPVERETVEEVTMDMFQ